MKLLIIGVLAVCAGAQPNENLLWRYRNLGKAFYENPTTQKQAVEEFRRALSLAPNSARERLNYGLALLRAGDVKNGSAELERVQKQDPRIPHTWFNLGVVYKKAGDMDRAQAQFTQMIRLEPNDAASHYQLGAILKTKGDLAGAVSEFETARRLDPHLAAPHFQLFGLYRQLERAQESAAELALFQEIKKQQEGAAVPEDMEWSAYAEIYDPVDMTPAAAPGPLLYRDEKLASDFGKGPGGVIALNASGARPSVIAWSPSKVVLYQNSRTAAAASGLETLRGVVSIAAGDFDNDGLPDLCVITAQGAALYRNTGGKFTRQSDLASGSFRKAVWLDYDHDYDLDLFLLGNDSRLLRNNGAAGFSDETKRFPFAAGQARDAAAFDLEPDTPGFDLVVSYAGRTGILYRDHLGGSYEAVPLAELPAGAAELLGADTNRDGRTDLAADGLLLLNRKGRFEKSTAAPGGGGVTADFDGSGKLDEVVLSPDGVLTARRNITPNSGNWIEIALTGVKSAKLAANAKVEVKAGASYQKATYHGTPLVFRLGARALVDTVRITWPNGLIQNEPNQAVNKIYTYKEAPRLSGSCPMIFTWDGERFTFLTDVLGVAPLGASSGDGEYFPVDHDEYVSIPGERMRPRNGGYELRISEELREVSYLDQIKLIALDHPAAVEVVTNEKFHSPPFPEFRLFGVERRVYPERAHDHRGQDVAAALRARDRRYPDAFRRDSAGVAEKHYLDLDFGKAASAHQAVLILHGWVDWADGSTFLAAMQEHKDLTFPYLQVKDAEGRWQTVVEELGIPAGKPKTIAVDLTGKFLSGSREVRIVTNLCVYWDEIFLIENSAAPEVRLTDAQPLSADLHFRGFSKPTIHRERKQPEMFDYDAVSSTSLWNPTAGNYTRYGDVQELLTTPDDRMVLMGSGDELTLRFSTALPPLPAGWKRDFLLLVDGWAKDADANTAFSQSVLPLPFHGMSRYPYPAGERYPTDAVHDEYQKRYNTRPALRLIRPLTEEPD